MARILEPPKEWQINCEYCGSLVGYTKVDIQENETSIRGEWEIVCQCPNCSRGIRVPKDELLRIEVPDTK
jgi:Zn finger protein HypA/HybF involved in hydrogenase expression